MSGPQPAATSRGDAAAPAGAEEPAQQQQPTWTGTWHSQVEDIELRRRVIHHMCVGGSALSDSAL